MLIARKGMFGLETETYLGEHTYNTHELDIIKFYINNADDKEYCFVIASFNKNGEIVSCGDRLFKEIETQTEFDEVKTLAKIGELIIANTDKVDTETKEIDIKKGKIYADFIGYSC